MSTSEKIVRRLRYIRRGSPFSVEQLYELGTNSSVQKAMSRLAQEGVVDRVAKGIYARPKHLASMPSVKVRVSAKRIAEKWAKQYGYTLVKQGVESSYRLGFQTQAPARAVFWSDGSSRTFTTGYEVVEVRHVAKSKLRWKSSPEGELLRSFMVTPASTIKLSQIETALERLRLSKSESRAVIRKLRAIPLPRGWNVKLEQLERALLA